MPTYEIEFNGKTVEVESDQELAPEALKSYAQKALGSPPPDVGRTGPTPQQIEKALVPDPWAKEPLPGSGGLYKQGSLTEGLKGMAKAGLGLGEAAGAALTGAAASAVGGVAGVGRAAGALAMGDSLEDAADKGANVVRRVQDTATYQPRTEAGQGIAGAVAKPFEMANAGLGSVGEAVGGLVGPKTAAAGRTLGENAIDLVSAGYGAGKAIGATRAPHQMTKVSQPRQAIAAAQADGFMADPAIANPSLFNSALEGIADQPRVQQRIATKNIEHASKLARRDLGLADDAALNESTLSNIRDHAGQRYEAIKNLPGDVPMDQIFRDAIDQLDASFASQKETHPTRYAQGELEQIKSSFANPEIPYTPRSIIEIIRRERSSANHDLRRPNLTANELDAAMAQKKAASALEDLLERHLDATGNKAMLSSFREARQTIAKTYNIEEATNLTKGTVDPLKLRRMLNNGERLSGNLEKIARAADAMPEVMGLSEVANPSLMPHLGDWGAAAAIGAMTGNPGAIVAAGVRPAAMAATSSPMYQRLAAKVRPKAMTNTPIYETTKLPAAAGAQSAYEESTNR